MNATSASAPRVTLYGRPGCHLCDEAREVLLALRAEGMRFQLRELNIEDDERLLRVHLERIPVIEIDGSEVSQLAPDAGALRAALSARSVVSGP
ncbi:MAG TPA: glutaredoxin family protein [Solirubrobacterales bacterium]|nr:glutaredoxin family protein [Solirubrobacterales bacterium]